jgi:nucleoside-diphosphate-sugar epimerase
LEHIRQGKTTTYYQANHAFSRIHVTDIARVLIASMHHPTPGHIFNVCDNEPAPLHEVQQYGAQLLAQPALTEIPIAAADLSPRMLQFFNDSKKVRNDKIKQQLGIQLTFPNYRSGLQHECHKLTQTE